MIPVGHELFAVECWFDWVLFKNGNSVSFPVGGVVLSKLHEIVSVLDIFELRRSISSVLLATA